MAAEHEVKPLPFAYDALEGISEQVMRWHHDRIYSTFVERRNVIERQLQTADRGTSNPLHSEFASLKRSELRLANAMALHQLFYESLGGDGRPEGTRILDRIRDDFGSFESWREDLIACALAAESWAILAWDSSDDRLADYIIDHDTSAPWGAVPLIVIDVAEHAYYYDHGPKRETYVHAVLDNLSWKAIDKRYVLAVPE